MPSKKSSKSSSENSRKKGAAQNTVDQEIGKRHFRVSIFGSARIKPDDDIYRKAYELARMIGQEGYDVVTGGGPGIMEASNAGHKQGNEEAGVESDSIGLPIRLPWENEPNGHLTQEKSFDHFSDRLDTFMALSNVVVVMPGGVGTCLELFYTWQLVQVKHICPIAIVLVGDMWKELMKWAKKYPFKCGLISEGDFDTIHTAKNEKEAFKLIQMSHEMYQKMGPNACLNANLYKV